MKKFTKRMYVAAASVAVASGAVLGAGGTASAATPASGHIQRPAVSAKADDDRWDRGDYYYHYYWDRWDHGDSYLWDGHRDWRHGGNRHDDCLIDSVHYCYHRWDAGDRGWKYDKARYDWGDYNRDRNGDDC